MKKNERDMLKNLSVDELYAKEVELRHELFTQRLHRATKPIKDNKSASKLRKNIARVLTIIQLKHESV